MRSAPLCILLLAGCSPAVFTLTPEEARLPDLGPPPPSIGGLPGEETSVRGVVRWNGAVPPMRVMEWSYCRPLITRTVPSEACVVDADNHLRWAFVVVTKGLEGRTFDVPKDPLRIDIRGHRFWPHVVGVRVGQEFGIANGEDHFYTVHGLPFDNPEFNLGLHKGMETRRRADRPEVMFAVLDSIHPWMRLWMGAVDHPFFAVTGPDGRFELRGLPPGRYTLTVWHERFVSAEREIEIWKGEELFLDIPLDRLKD